MRYSFHPREERSRMPQSGYAALRRALLLLFVCCTQTPAADPSGTYVRKDHTCNRIEFLPGGRCYVKTCSGYYESTYAQEEGVCLCKTGDDTRLSLRSNGNLFVDQEDRQWVPREDIVKRPWKEELPVTVTVIDANTGKPVPEFLYTYSIDTPQGSYDPLLARQTRVRSDDGSFTLAAPPSCEIRICIEGRDLVGGYGTCKTLDLTARNKRRRMQVRVQSGATVTGIVTAAESGSPIEGALVSPVVFTPPLFSPDRKRGVATDVEGRFTVWGVDPGLGINVRHSDYLECEERGLERSAGRTGERMYSAMVKLEKGRTISGTVRDCGGQPIADVTVSDGAGKNVLTRKDGSFVLRSPKKGPGNDAFTVTFEKQGYVDKTIRDAEPDPGGVSIVLEFQPVLTGRVVDRQGNPVRECVVFAGPGEEPEDWECTSARIAAGSEAFSLAIEKRESGVPGDETNAGRTKVWVGVRSCGHAMWEGSVSEQDARTPLDIRLSSGTSVTGRLRPHDGKATRVFAKIVPERRQRHSRGGDLTQRQKIGTLQAAAGPDGSFKFEHVAPGGYTLYCFGEGLSPLSVDISVTEAGLDLGAMEVGGTGVVFGRVHSPPRGREKRGVWRFADGEIDFRDSSGRGSGSGTDVEHLQAISFKADENGGFRVENVPTGEVAVSIPYHLSADMIGAHVRVARVVEGKSTEVRFFEPSGDWDVPLEFVVGDGSRRQYASGTGTDAKRQVDNVTTRAPMFAVALMPLDPGPVSYPCGDWEEPDGNRRIVLQDVTPGRYRLKVGDWLGSTGFTEGHLFEADVETGPNRTRPIRVNLGGGSVLGQVRCSGDNRYMIEVIAAGMDPKGVIRRTRCDDRGNFCVRYLPEGEYALYARDCKAGWATLPSARVKNNSMDVGSHLLGGGGTIKGTIAYASGQPRATGVVAKDLRGIAVEAPDFVDAGGRDYVISSLWPGKWTVAVMRAESAGVSREVVLRGEETAQCDFVVE